MCMTHTRKCNKKNHNSLFAVDLLETEEVAICIMTHIVRVFRRMKIKIKTKHKKI